MSKQRQQATSLCARATAKVPLRSSDAPAVHAKPTTRGHFAVRNPVAIASAVLDSIQRERSSAGSQPADTSHANSSSCSLPSITHHLHSSTADTTRVATAAAPALLQRPCTRGRAHAASSDSSQTLAPSLTAQATSESDELPDVRHSAPFRAPASSSSTSVGLFSLTRPSWTARTSEPGAHIHSPTSALDNSHTRNPRVSEGGSVILGGGGRRVRLQTTQGGLQEEEEAGEPGTGAHDTLLMAGERSSYHDGGQHSTRAVRVLLERATPVSQSLPHPIGSGQLLKPIDGYPSVGTLNPKHPVGATSEPAPAYTTRRAARFQAFSEPGYDVSGCEDEVGGSTVSGTDKGPDSAEMGLQGQGVWPSEEGAEVDDSALYDEDLQYVTEEELQYIKANYDILKSASGDSPTHTTTSTAGAACRLPPKAGSTGSLRRTLSNAHRPAVPSTSHPAMATPLRPAASSRTSRRPQPPTSPAPAASTAAMAGAPESSMPRRYNARRFNPQLLASLQARVCEQEVDWEDVATDAEAAASRGGEHSDQEASAPLDISAYEEDLKYVTADELRSLMKRYESLPRHQPSGAPHGTPKRMSSLRPSRA